MHYTINQDKLAEVVAIIRGHRTMGVSEVEAFCLADWPEGEEHQHWLDNAPASEIADWVIAGSGDEG